MRNRTLLLVMSVIGIMLVTPQMAPTASKKVEHVTDTVKVNEIDVLINNINEDLSKAIADKESLERLRKEKEALKKENDTRLKRVLRLIKSKPKNNTVVVDRQVIIKEVRTKERYKVREDSICVRKPAFSKKCSKWDKIFILTDVKTGDSLTLKNK